MFGAGNAGRHRSDTDTDCDADPAKPDRYRDARADCYRNAVTNPQPDDSARVPNGECLANRGR